jgi:hypothetical protein
MTIFNLDKEEQGDWFAFFSSKIDQSTGEISYNPPEPDAAEFRVRSMASFFENRRKGRKKEYKMVLNPSTRAMERVGYFEDLPAEEATKENEDLWDYAITGIKNAFSASGEPIECTRENKLKLLEIPIFLRFMTRVFQMLTEAGIKQKASAEKN